MRLSDFAPTDGLCYAEATPRSLQSARVGDVEGCSRSDGGDGSSGGVGVVTRWMRRRCQRSLSRSLSSLTV